mgnify:CR=1 FL=1
MKTNKVLVTGAGGFIGTLMVEMLLKNKCSVVALDRYFFGVDKLKAFENHTNLKIVKEDTRYVSESIFKDIDIVIDLAGLSNDASCEIDPSLTHNINNLGAIRMIKAAKKAGVRRYIYSSSASVYGFNEALGLNETGDQNPQTIYAKSKVAVEETLLQERTKNFEVVMLRNATVYGVAPRMRMDLCINIMTARAWSEGIIKIENGGMQWRPFVHVRDVVKAFELVMKADGKLVDGEAFNVGSNEQNYTISDIANLVAKELPRTAIHNTGDDMDYRSYNLNFDKIERVLGYKPSMSVSDGIKEVIKALEKKVITYDDPKGYTLQWYINLMEWEKRVKELSYDGKMF